MKKIINFIFWKSIQMIVKRSISEKLINASKTENLENIIDCFNSKVDVNAVGSEKLTALQSACNSLKK